MNVKMHLFRGLTVAAVLLSIASCTSPVGIELQYYLIEPGSADTAPSENSTQNLKIEIRDLSIPKYLERYQIAKRSSANTIRYSESNQWGENLQKNLLRVIAMNLSRELGTADIATPLNRLNIKPNYHLRIHVERFEQSENGEIALLARYQISDPSGKTVLPTIKFEALSRRISRSDYAEMVTEMSDLFHQLSQDVARNFKKANSE